MYEALKRGYRLIDTAKYYGNEREVGRAQVILRWHIQAGYIAVPGSGDPAHIAENFAVWDFTLTDEDMARLAALNKQRRYENW